MNAVDVKINGLNKQVDLGNCKIKNCDTYVKHFFFPTPDAKPKCSPARIQSVPPRVIHKYMQWYNLAFNTN